MPNSTAYKRVNLSVQAPSVFVGVHEYPQLRVGLLTTKQDNHHDDPSYWSKLNFGIEDVTKRRRTLLNSSFETIAVNQRSRFLDVAKELSLSDSATDIDVEVEPRDLRLLQNQGEAIPFGPRASLLNASIQGNVKTNYHLERAAEDVDCLAQTALFELYDRGIKDHSLTRVLSMGNLGIGKNRKLVPTKWSITAVDDIVGKKILKDMPTFDTAPTHAFSVDYIGNHFLVLIFDNTWMYELIEVMPDGKTLSSDCELTYGRKAYVNETAGAYYAVRLSILEYLHRHQWQAGVVVLRFITPDYHTPLGVWVVRETIRKALAQKPIWFESKFLLSEFARKWCEKKFKFDFSKALKKSIALQELLSQKKLEDFFS